MGRLAAAWALMSLICGGLLLLLRLLRPVLERCCGPVVQYTYLAAVDLAALLPLPLLFSGRPIASAAETAMEFVEVSPSTVAGIAANSTPMAPLRPIAGWVCLVWLLGTTVALGAVLVRGRQVRAGLRRLCRPAHSEQVAALRDCCAELHIRRGVSLQIVPGVGSPFLYGFLRPVIILPEQGYSRQELRCIFHHELTHLRQNAPLIQTLLLVTNAAFWYNPIFWQARREASRLCELACDAAVTKQMDVLERRAYAALLLHTLLAVRETGAMVPLNRASRDLERRIRMIQNRKKTNKAITFFLVLALLVTGTVSVRAAGGVIPAEVGVEEIAARPAEAGSETVASEFPEYTELEVSEVRATIALAAARNGDGDVSTAALYALYYINSVSIGGSSYKLITSPTGNAYNLKSGKTVDYDLTWFPRNNLQIGLYDTSNGVVYSLKTIKNGSAIGSLTVPHDGQFKFYIKNTGSDPTTVNGTIDI